MTYRRTLLLVLILACSLITAENAAAGKQKETICHVPQYNPGNAHTITVSKNAVRAHLDHHWCDYVGPCSDYFPNGVASGDVNQSSVVLWARAEYAGTVTFEIGQDPDFSGSPDGVLSVVVDDPVVPAKVEFSELFEGTQYYYRACRGDACDDECPYSLLLGSEARGSFRTPHTGGHNGLRFGVSSCWRGDLKPFRSIQNAPDRDLDFFVALGDTTYADSPITKNATGETERSFDLDDYRTKNECVYSQQRCLGDEDLLDSNTFADLRASTAFYVNIDDHEVINNFAGGATPLSQLETPECRLTIPGVFEDPWGVCFCPDPDPNNNCDRRFNNETDLFNDALQAWQEYNPIREERYGQTGDSRTARKRKLYRYRTFGKDAAMFMLDTRSFRVEPVPLFGLIPIALPLAAYERGRTMLGSAQLTDLLRDLKDAEGKGITWKFVMVPEPIQNLGWITAEDRFEGYSRERGQILDYIQSFCISNVVFISGDIHATLANNLIYKKNFGLFKRYSETWDISTGAVAYGTPYAEALVEKLNGALEACAGDSICESLLPDELPVDGFDLLPPEQQNLLAETLLNTMLTIFRLPTVGLDSEHVYATFLQKENANTPATLLQGRYSALATWGWTEFEVDAATSNLKVTTYGIDPKDPNVTHVPIVSQFEVAPTTRAGNGAECSDDTDCASCRCSLLGECISGLANGALCLFDDQCRSDRCSTAGSTILARCQPKAPNGASCWWDDDCLAGDCHPALNPDGRCWPLPDGQSSSSLHDSDRCSPRRHVKDGVEYELPGAGIEECESGTRGKRSM